MSRPVIAATVSGARRAAVIAGLVATVLAGCGTGGLPGHHPPSVAPATATASPPRRRRRPPARRRRHPPRLRRPRSRNRPARPSRGSCRGRATGPSGRSPGTAPDRARRGSCPGCEPGGTGCGARRRVRTRGVARGLEGPLGARHGSGAGDVASGVDGVGPVAIVAPGEAGAWSLQLEASFGQGRTGTWYWRLEVGP